MTATDLTRFSFLLDLEDMDGIIDIAKCGIEQLVEHKPICALVNKLAYSIAKASTGENFELKKFDRAEFEDFDDDPMLAFQGRALIRVFSLPINSLTKLDYPGDERFS